jgi:hypothetical protein
MGAFDLRVPFFEPIWRRVLLTAICFGWCIVELIMGDPFWGFISGVFGAIVFWNFFFREWAESPDKID